jgi:uncharacterized protein YjbK
MADEIEWKLVLDAAAAARLTAALALRLGPGTAREQENRFIDTPDRRLRRARMNLRLRRERCPSGTIVLVTGKRPPAAARTAPGLFHHDEIESVVNDPPWDALLADLRRVPLHPDWQAALGDAPRVDLGGFSNQRLTWDADGEHICLDETHFPDGRVDHEVEIETNDPERTEARWRRLLAAVAAPWRPQTKSKFFRFMECAGV